MKALALLAIAFMLTGCAEFSAMKSGIAQHGAAAADEALAIAKWQTCLATPIGALERELGGDPERIAGWILYCAKKPTTSPLLPQQMQTKPQAGANRL